MILEPTIISCGCPAALAGHRRCSPGRRIWRDISEFAASSFAGGFASWYFARLRRINDSRHFAKH